MHGLGNVISGGEVSSPSKRKGKCKTILSPWVHGHKARLQQMKDNYRSLLNRKNWWPGGSTSSS
jgi:hypothetical protein